MNHDGQKGSGGLKINYEFDNYILFVGGVGCLAINNDTDTGTPTQTQTTTPTTTPSSKPDSDIDGDSDRASVQTQDFCYTFDMSCMLYTFI